MSDLLASMGRLAEECISNDRCKLGTTQQVRSRPALPWVGRFHNHFNICTEISAPALAPDAKPDVVRSWPWVEHLILNMPCVTVSILLQALVPGDWQAAHHSRELP